MRETRAEEAPLSKVLEVCLTRACNYHCSYCNQRQTLSGPMRDLSESGRNLLAKGTRPGHEWIEGLNRFPFKPQYDKLVIWGGEPSLHPGFFDIVSRVQGYPLTLIITNLSFDPDRLIAACRRQRGRVVVQPSFHFECAEFEAFCGKLRRLREANLLSNFIPVSVVNLPGRSEGRDWCWRLRRCGFNASLYPFEGYYRGVFYNAPAEGFGGGLARRRVLFSSCCHSVRPDGDIVYCTTGIYLEESAVYGNICDQYYREIPSEILSDNYGREHVSASSWVRARDPQTGDCLWQGKNYRRRTPLTRLRNFMEAGNYFWLGAAKRVVNTAQERLRRFDFHRGVHRD